MDDPGARSLLPRIKRRVVTYGRVGRGAASRRANVRLDAGGTTFDVCDAEQGRARRRCACGFPGRHNVANALAAIAVGRELSIPFETIARALEAFTGVVRRFERKGERAGVLVVDDYAHHPTEIAATLAAARQVYPDRRLVALFQPHLFSRTRDFADDVRPRPLGGRRLGSSWTSTRSREKPIPGVTGELVADAAAQGRRGHAAVIVCP